MFHGNPVTDQDDLWDGRVLQLLPTGIELRTKEKSMGIEFTMCSRIGSLDLFVDDFKWWI